MNTTSITAMETVRAILLRDLPHKHEIKVNGKSYWTVPHVTTEGNRYNLQIEDRYYRDLTLSSLALVIANDQ